jgi:alkanesulfonate monooxygenase SsuD/methylene tetrahydromethanopterin reductase-like flavin-dependent oxidoreductase (luciferase family)
MKSLASPTAASQRASSSKIWFGVQSVEPAVEVPRLAAEAERLGFARFLVPDHPGTTDDPFVQLAAAASSTERIGCGTYVLNAGIREPWQVATAAATLVRTFGPRFILGVGAGHTPQEWMLAGQEQPSPSERVARLGEFVELLIKLLSGEPASHQGQYFRLSRHGCR